MSAQFSRKVSGAALATACRGEALVPMGIAFFSGRPGLPTQPTLQSYRPVGFVSVSIRSLVYQDV